MTAVMHLCINVLLVFRNGHQLIFQTLSIEKKKHAMVLISVDRRKEKKTDIFTLKVYNMQSYTTFVLGVTDW